MSINKRKINELIDENYVYASVLFYFGIEFYNYSEKTLEEACSEKGIKVSVLIKELEQVSQKGEEHDLFLMSYPIDLIIEYLKHRHYIFIKQKLPFLMRLVGNLKSNNPNDEGLIKDLQFVLPIFVEDFIHHIYEEEDRLFSYILALKKALKEDYKPGELYYSLEKNAIHKFAVEHEVHDDEMIGIRNITNDYAVDSTTDRSLKVMFSALEEFENDLKVHSKVENEILFPKALMLEKEVVKKFRSKIQLN